MLYSYKWRHMFISELHMRKVQKLGALDYTQLHRWAVWRVTTFLITWSAFIFSQLHNVKQSENVLLLNSKPK